MVVWLFFLRWCFCGGGLCGGVFVVLWWRFLWWCFCGGVLRGGVFGDRGQLRPDPRYPPEFYGRVNVFYPYQGSAATLPDLSVKNPTGFYTISRFDGFMV